MGFAAIAAPAHAENWRITPSASLTETYTSNANYASQGAAQSDWVTSVTGAMQISGEGARLKVNGSIAATGWFYANQTQNNSFAPTVTLASTLEAVEKFFYIEANANVTQTFLSPFGPQPGSLVNTTANRYTSQTYTVAPYIKGVIPGTYLTYDIRDDNIWTIASQYGDTSLSVPNTYLNRLHASLNSTASPLGWTAEYIGTRYEPTGGEVDTVGTYTIQVGRGIVYYQFDPHLRLAVRGGYENEQFPLTGSEGVIYGLGGTWAPTDRMLINGFWEHRFFGSSYSFQFTDRMPRVAVSANFSRGLETYPQNALSIPAGANVAAFVEAAFTTRIPDPAERALAVQQFLASSGLPATLATPVNFFAANILLQNSASATVVLLGVRNSLAFNAFYLKSEAIAGTGSALPPALQFGENNTQTGGGASFNHQISGMTNLTASATYSTTTSNATRGLFADLRTTNAYLNVGIGTRLGPKTTATAGAGYTRFVPNGEIDAQTSSSYNIYAGINHTF
ncbi:MAG: TIGR03016 family PEP-CTERM system-associated outer membrane protein [Betaproteobacteria bacterium]